MIRPGLVALMIGILLADPLLCGSAEAEAPCDGRCAETPARDDGHGPAPLDVCHDEGHECACQGVTNQPTGKADESSGAMGKALPSPLTSRPDLPESRPPARPPIPRPEDADGPPVGRSLRIALGSFRD
ncbi:hypothetical protein [Tautonia plasticadhaerens]|nr:hypothetical protein [Tautonia plasticadhaerens]